VHPRRDYRTIKNGGLGATLVSIDPEHLTLILRIVHRLARRLPRVVDPGDLLSDGFLGLHRASERYDRSRGVPFEHFAAPWIRGAILDGLRARDRFPKGFRSGNRYIPKFLNSMTTLVSGPNENSYERRDLLQCALRNLPRRARLLIQLYYFEQMTMHQIAACLGITESAISQQHAGALRQLKHSGEFDQR